MIVAVEGKKFEGKTTLAVNIARRTQVEKLAYPILMFDPKWSIRSDFRTGKIFTSVTIGEDFGEFAENITERADMHVYHPRIDMTEDFTKTVWSEFSNFVEAIDLEYFLREIPRRPVIILIDEAEYLQYGKSIHPALGNAIRLATEGKMYIILTCHGPRELIPLVRRHISRFYFFRLDDQADLSYVQERCGALVAESVSNLQPHHYLMFDARTRESVINDLPDSWKMEEQIGTRGGIQNAARIA